MIPSGISLWYKSREFISSPNFSIWQLQGHLDLIALTLF